jgi:glycosyltransferase involved in cell wall biosynthesis
MNIGRSTIDMSSTDTPRKKAILIRNAASYDFGGAERFVVLLSKELDKNGWDTTIVTAHKTTIKHAKSEHQSVIKGPWLTRQDWSGAKLLLAPIYVFWQIYLISWYLLLFARLKPDVVHPQSKDDFIGATIAATLLGKRVIWTDHADLKYIFENVTVPYKNFVGKLVRRSSKYAQAITLVSKSEGRLITAQFGESKLPGNYHVVYNGLTDRVIPIYERPKNDRSAVVFCITSRLVTAKGIGELIIAFKKIDKPDLRLWILGEGPEEQKFHEQASDNPHITFLGYPENSLSMLKSADVFVHPSYHEGFSISILEATMLGKPIITCTTGGNPEIVINKQNGLLVPVKDIDSLAEAMELLANDDAMRDRLGKAARDTFLHSFQFDKIVKEEFIPLYEN